MKITDLTNYSTLDNSDVLPVVDVVNDTTKKVTRTNLFKNPPLEDGVITPKLLTTGTGTSWAWQNWTVTLTNITKGNGTETAKYIQIGKTVHFFYKLVLGSTSSISGLIGISLPVTAKSNFADNDIIADVKFRDDSTGTDNYGTGALAGTRTRINALVYNAASTYLGTSSTSSTVPFTWATSDVIQAIGTYEAA